MNDYYGDDGWDFGRRQRRPSPHQMRSDYRNGLLDPGFAGSGLYRSRSQGHGPAPTINVYNRMYQDQEGSPLPPYPTNSSSSRRASPRASPESRGRSRLGDRLGDNLENELAEMALEHRFRSRSRGRSDASGFDRPPSGLAEWQLREVSRERAWRLEQDRLRDKMKVEALEAELKRDKEEEASRERERRWKEKYRLDQIEAEMKKDREEEAAKEKEKRLIAEHERKVREAEEKRKAEEKRAVQEYERKQREAKEKAAEEERRLKEKLEREAKEAKEKKEKQYQDFLREQKERKEKKEKEAKEAEEKFQAEMRKRLQNLGYSERTIEIMIDEEKTKQFKKDLNERTPSPYHRSPSGHPGDTVIHVGDWRAPKAPVYPKVHRDYLAVETLKYYDLPWEYDPVRLPPPTQQHHRSRKQKRLAGHILRYF